MDYINFALSDACQPILADPADPLDLDLSVLDERCTSQGMNNFLPNIDAFLDPNHDLSPEESALINPILSMRTDGTFVLSLSGGVDSMCLLLLLRKAHIPFVAVHIRHSSRIEDTRKELDWVRFVCARLDVPLYYHHVLVARPHGDFKGEISRDEFENYTRQIRFCMYRKAAALLSNPDNDDGDDEIFVLIGHHMDDVDENRISELGKGNLIDIDGMNEDGGETGDTLFCITQLRPFCRDVRKCQLRDFAVKHGIPHMKNSTPKWSKRGWIRDVLDMNNDLRVLFVSKLESMGCLSKHVDEITKKICGEWILNHPLSTGEMCAETKTKKFILKVARIDLDTIFSIVIESVVPVVRELILLVNDFAPIWNRTFKALADERGVTDCPIQEIKLLNDNSDEVPIICLNRCFQVLFGHVKPVLGVEKFVTRKSIAQLIELVRSKRCCVTWKINRVDVHMVYIKNVWYVVDRRDLERTVETVFGGSMEAFRKCVISNQDKISIS